MASFSEKAYELRLYDRTLMSFTVRSTPFAAPAVTDVRADSRTRALMPPRLVIAQDGADVMSWLESRVVPKNRAFVDRLLQQVGLTPGDTMGIIDVSLGLSLNDAYWVVPEGFEGSWARYNLYENDFDAALSLVAYTGRTSSQQHQAGLSSEWTTSGNYPKAWRRIEGEVRLYKSGSPIFEGTANPDLGPYSEFLCAQVADALGVPHVPYSLEVWEGRLASVCPLMNDESTSFVPFHAATGAAGFASTARTMLELGDDALGPYLDMLVFDAIVLNPDRHANNFGFLRDNATGSYLGMAPLFDHNLALFPHDLPSDWPLWGRAGATTRPAGAYQSFDDLAALVMLERHHEWCRGLLAFSFENDAAHPLDESRLQELTRFIRQRARTLLSMPSHALGNVRAVLKSELPDVETARMPILAQRDLDAS